jgi:hypothetical protein
MGSDTVLGVSSSLSSIFDFCSAGELKPAEIDKVLDVIAKPEEYKVRVPALVFPCLFVGVNHFCGLFSSWI